MKFKKNKNVYFVLFYQYKCYFYTTDCYKWKVRKGRKVEKKKIFGTK